MPKLSTLSQKGYIGLTIVVFMLMLAMLVYPWLFPGKSSPVGCTVGKEPKTRTEISGIAGIKDLDADGHQSSSIEQGGPDPEQTSTFVMIRENVPTLKRVWSDPKNKKNLDYEFLGSATFTHNSHTINVGELSQKPGFDAYYPAKWGEIDLPGNKTVYIRNEGLLFFAKKDPAFIKQLPENTVYLTDVYQDISKVGEGPEAYKGKGATYFACIDSAGNATGNEVLVPEQNVSNRKEQLQMEWFKFGDAGTWGIHCKPAVYLYPQRKQLVNVRVFPKGELSYTDPPYDKDKGWTVWAEPNGDLYEAIRSQSSAVSKYEYLYYESKIRDKEIRKPEVGWVVKFNELEGLFNRELPRLGLNEKEKGDFMKYWLGKLPVSPYYFVGLIDKSQRDYLEALEVNPEPETSIRFSLYFEALDQLRIVKEPVINTPKRNGFTLVDWGGMIKLHPGTEFTCSQ